MSAIYHASAARSNNYAAACLGGLCILAVFSLFPLLHTFSQMTATTDPPAIRTGTIDTPDQIIEVEDPIEEPEEIDKPIFEDQLPDVPFDFLHILFEPGDGGSGISTYFRTGGAVLDTKIDVFDWNAVEKRPRVIVASTPVYPYDMKRVSGEVIVEFIIEADGKVRSPRIYKSSHKAFEQPALDAVLRSKWEPGENGGKKVATRVRLPIAFHP